MLILDARAEAVCCSVAQSCKLYVYSVEILPSARKHGIVDADIEHAYENAIRLVEYEYAGQERLLVIGPAGTARCLSWWQCPPPHRLGLSTPTGCGPAASIT